jgi:hypothetical protein
MAMRAQRWGAAALVVAAVVAGCTPITVERESRKAAEGADAVGRSLLSEHRGKVVLLSFWHSS